ncbi:uncharacterized protein LOC142472776 [Ascaphus truei]|uniref:uncharacterized protein LOC142472776 n=1 Tax=Ascaphus truei TaxID=8439 RepID=UPI003F59FD47
MAELANRQSSHAHIKEEATVRPLPATITERDQHTDTSYLTDMGKYLIWESLTNFDDCPENYRAWKFGFKDVIQRLGFSEREELILLTKWLGKESAEHAKRLRAATINHPRRGLDLVWERLEEYYGSPEVVQDALFKRVDNFPRITAQNYIKLWELGDLLQHLESLRADQSQSDLNFLDSARFLRPILEKLPYNLQERWTSQGSKYKREKQVAFPPFSFFLSFLREAARTKNDPSFFLGTPTTPSASNIKNEGPVTRYGSTRTPISVHKNDVSPKTSTRPNHSTTPSRETGDPNRECPIHRKPHPLNKCFGFRMKPIEERKNLLREFGVCFRCCASVTHLSKDCKEAIKCTVCNSDKHVTSLHTEALTLDQLNNPSSVAKHDVEEEEVKSISVTSQSTKVCGGGCDQSFCSKTCLVAVYPNGQPERAIRMYAIIDDQSHRSLVRSEFFDLFNIQDSVSPYTLRTCAGLTETTRRANGYTIHSVDGRVKIPLPTLIECNHMAANRNEIPTPDVARHHQHLRGIADRIPPIEQDAKILLLLGRDIPRVHKIREQRNGPHNAPFAQRLDLGWVIVGNVCIGKGHKPDYVDAHRTDIMKHGHTSLFKPCLGHIQVTGRPRKEEKQGHTPENHKNIFTSGECDNDLGCSAVQTTKDDESTSPREENNLLKVIDNEIVHDKTNNRTTLLPLHPPSGHPLTKGKGVDGSTQPNQWHHVPTDQNPADHAARSVSAAHLQSTLWLTRSKVPTQPDGAPSAPADDFELVDHEKDTEIQPQVSVLLMNTFGSHRFNRFSRWTSLLRAMAHLRHIATSFHQTSGGKTASCHGWHICKRLHTVIEITEAKRTVLQHVQKETYAEEISYINGKKGISKNSPLWKLDPFIDENGLMRIGGRLSKSQLRREESNPLIVPGRHHIATLLVRHYHEQVMHQGRHFTEGAIRAAGIWIIGTKRCITSVLHRCVKCRMLRGKSQDQRIVDLPPDRLSTEPPFTSVGLDVFGPWAVISRRTRGGLANSKRWAVLFTCMSTQAIHIEVIESMDASSFINALRRFFAIRGPVKQIRFDCGTNFVGACKELQINTKDSEDNSIQKYLRDQECTWMFNSPHSSHMGGAWELMIRVARRILDSMMLKTDLAQLSHEVLMTFMAEVSAIVNARPLVPVSTDPESPSILTPAMLLTQKVGSIPVPAGDFNSKDMYKRQWRQVQCLANTFWERWRREYLVTLQECHK